MTTAFIIGPPRTGTTLFTRLLYQHSDIVGLHEEYVLEWTSGPSICQAGGAAAHGFTTAQSERWRDRMERGPVVDAFRDVMEDAWEMLGPAPVRVGSWPFYYRHLDVLRAAFPDALYLCTTRDEAAVAASATRKWGTADECVGWYRDAMTAASCAMGIRLRWVHYHDLCSAPELTMRAEWAALGLDPGKGWLDYDASRDVAPGRWQNDPRALLRPGERA